MSPAQKMNSEKRFGFVANELCLDFANTAGWHVAEKPSEGLRSYADLAQWAYEAEILNGDDLANVLDNAQAGPAQANLVLSKAVELREALFRIFTAQANHQAADANDLELLNRELDAAPARVQVHVSDGEYKLDWLLRSATLDGMLAPVVWSAARLMDSENFGLVKQCEGDPCGWLFVDTTRNHSRRWCDMNDCGSRAKAKRYYYRHKGE